MVHALQLTHGILQPNGLLINIHELPAPNLIEVHTPESVHKVGWLLDNEDFENERYAFSGLAQVVEDGLFTLEDERNFTYNIYIDTLKEMQEWLAEWWTSATLPDRTLQWLEELMRNGSQPARIVIKEQARMTKLKANNL